MSDSEAGRDRVLHSCQEIERQINALRANLVVLPEFS